MQKRKADMQTLQVLVAFLLVVVIFAVTRHGSTSTLGPAVKSCTAQVDQEAQDATVAAEIATNAAVYGSEAFRPLDATKEYDAAVKNANQLDKLMPPSFHGSNPTAITRGQVTRSVQLTALMRQPEGTRSATKRVTGTPNLITNVLCATKALALTEQAIPFGDSDARQVAIMSTTRKYTLPVA
jgi:hypothetical protein